MSTRSDRVEVCALLGLRLLGAVLVLFAVVRRVPFRACVLLDLRAAVCLLFFVFATALSYPLIGGFGPLIQLLA